ncbi:MAG TPA: DUF4032 domain-containing protein [bacterium]|nr:DUF4032 domain-containing protein [bacterium]HQP98260.1 DUF4032 domain-containing protein [bacterium]
MSNDLCSYSQKGDIAQLTARDFRRARFRSFLNGITAFLNGRSTSLLSYQQVRSSLRISSECYLGLRSVPLDHIVGSVGRYHDFDQGFMPKRDIMEGRWRHVDDAHYSQVELPPVKLNKIGGLYFVIDGNHRVSVAREKGAEFIDAEVIECKINVPLLPDEDPHSTLMRAEREQFLHATHLDRLRGADIRFTTHGRYMKLLHHIDVYRYFRNKAEKREISYEDGVLGWYDEIYLPVVEMVRREQVLEDFPGRTEGDLYIWIMNHRYYLNENYGTDVGPEAATEDFARRFHGKPTGALMRLFGLESESDRELLPAPSSDFST